MPTTPTAAQTPDLFALLGEPRRPWVNPDEVQARFLAQSAEVHPDRVHNAPEAERAEANQRFAHLNAACKCLRDPRQRLRHLLELERGLPISNLERVPGASTDFYFQLGDTVRRVDLFLAERARAVSRLARVRLFEAAMDWRDQLQSLQKRLTERRQALELELETMNAAWEKAPCVGDLLRLESLPLERLESLYREYSFVARWHDQIGERLLQLSLD